MSWNIILNNYNCIDLQIVISNTPQFLLIEKSHGVLNFSSPPRLDRLWGAPGFLSNGYRG